MLWPILSVWECIYVSSLMKQHSVTDSNCELSSPRCLQAGEGGDFLRKGDEAAGGEGGAHENRGRM